MEHRAGRVTGKLEGTVHSLARSGPEEALTVLNGLTADVRVPETVMKWLGDGVAESSAFDALSDCLILTDPDLLLRLVATSHRLGEELVTAMNADACRWLDILMHMLEGGGRTHPPTGTSPTVVTRRRFESPSRRFHRCSQALQILNWPILQWNSLVAARSARDPSTRRSQKSRELGQRGCRSRCGCKPSSDRGC